MRKSTSTSMPSHKLLGVVPVLHVLLSCSTRVTSFQLPAVPMLAARTASTSAPCSKRRRHSINYRYPPPPLPSWHVHRQEPTWRLYNADDGDGNQSQDVPSSPDTNISSNTSGRDDTLLFRSASYDILHSTFVGILTGLSVALFKKSIEAVRRLLYEGSHGIASSNLVVLLPAFGGLVVSALMSLGAFQPGLRGVVKRVDEASSTSRYATAGERIRLLMDSMRKSAASAATLGSGCSLGPEGPSVEIGMSVARACMDTSPGRCRDQADRIEWNHRLLSCGAAAGVAAGFNAPIAGVFFALEVLQDAFDSSSPSEYTAATQKKALTSTARLAPILTASVASALTAHSLLGDHFVFHLAQYSLKSPLAGLPLYILLGFVSGTVAFTFSRMARLFQGVFDGDIGFQFVRSGAKRIPNGFKPIIGGLFCGVLGLFFPQIRFFGEEAQNALLGNKSLPNTTLLSLLSVKMIATAFSVASGLVGGTFAPCLFLGSMTGALFHNAAKFLSISSVPGLALADVPAFAMIGAASVLAALFRAPLTASLLLFEMTRDYDVILPLMVSAGFGSVVGDILDSKVKQANKRQRPALQLMTPHVVKKKLSRIKERTRLRRDRDHVSWGDLSDPWEE